MHVDGRYAGRPSFCPGVAPPRDFPGPTGLLHSSDMPNRTTARFLFLFLAVALLGVVVFLPGLPGEFIFDDIPNITTNPAVHFTQLDLESVYRLMTGMQLSGITRSLPMLSFAIDYWRAGGPDPLTFKATNLLIHALTAIALAWLFRLLLKDAGLAETRVPWLAAALALAWAIHPLQVSSVLYVVQRIQTMGTLFLVLALSAYLLARQAQIAGRAGRPYFLLTFLLWILALGCKEDSALLPLYALALELTVLRFGAADARLAGRIRKLWLLAAVAGTALYLLAVVPHYWNGRDYIGRDFTTGERLLTQPRMLCLYLWQVLVPLPSNMPFYYDWVEPSRGWLQPWTTLPALAVVLALPALAWWQRTRRPLFSLGVLLFFAAHFMTSNVIALELAFEHRNHFALAGALLAIGDLLGLVAVRLRLPASARIALCVVLLAALGAATLVRAHTWNSALSISRLATERAPGSGRAWVQLCSSYFNEGGGAVPDNPMLDLAIETCEKGTTSAPKSLNSHALLIVLKTLRGSITRQDWESLRQRIGSVPMTHDNARIFMILVFHARKGVPLDGDELVRTLSVLSETDALGAFNYAQVGYFVMNDLGRPDDALPHFLRAIDRVRADDPFPGLLEYELMGIGRPDLSGIVKNKRLEKQASRE